MKKGSLKKQSSLIRIFILIIFVGIMAFYTYPTEISSKEAFLYLKSYGVTLGLTITIAVIGSILGVILAFLRFQGVWIVRILIDEYVDIMRGTPMLLQLLIFSIVVFSTWTNTFLIAAITLGLNSAAYIAEVVRSGIESIDKGQMEAARAIGMPYTLSMNEIIIPQAIKNILPALVSEFITLFKETSIVGYISVVDITMNSKSLQATYYSAKPLLFTGVVYYASVKLFSFIGKKLEGKLKKND